MERRERWRNDRTPGRVSPPLAYGALLHELARCKHGLPCRDGLPGARLAAACAGSWTVIVATCVTAGSWTVVTAGTWTSVAACGACLVCIVVISIVAAGALGPVRQIFAARITAGVTGPCGISTGITAGIAVIITHRVTTCCPCSVTACCPASVA